MRRTRKRTEADAVTVSSPAPEQTTPLDIVLKEDASKERWKVLRWRPVRRRSHKKEAEHSGHSEAGVVTCVLAGMICGLMMFVFSCVFSEMVRRMINHSQVVHMLPVLTRLAVAVVRYPLGRSLGRTNC